MKTARLGKPKVHTHNPVRSMHKYTAPHNRSKAGTTTPKGAPGGKPGTTIPKMAKGMSVADILHMKFPK